jgi:hypothetical protein
MREHGGRKAGLNFLVIDIRGLRLNFYSYNLAVENRLDKLDYVVGLTLVRENHRSVAGCGVRS